jgi:hypothetical protein
MTGSISLRLDPRELEAATPLSGPKLQGGSLIYRIGKKPFT